MQVDDVELRDEVPGLGDIAVPSPQGDGDPRSPSDANYSIVPRAVKPPLNFSPPHPVGCACPGCSELRVVLERFRVR